MAEIKVNKLTNCNVYIDGSSFAGQIEEFDIPELNFKMAEHKALGLFGTFELPSGLDKMEARLKWSSFYPDAVPQTSNPYQARQIMIRGNLEVYGAGGRTQEVPVTVTMTGFSKNLPGLKFKQHDNVEQESRFSITRVKCVVAGTTRFEVDVLANIATIGGQDILSGFRANT
jgi:P2 family phage contractile tail tube protein